MTIIVDIFYAIRPTSKRPTPANETISRFAMDIEAIIEALYRVYNRYRSKQEGLPQEVGTLRIVCHKQKYEGGEGVAHTLQQGSGGSEVASVTETSPSAADICYWTWV